MRRKTEDSKKKSRTQTKKDRRRKRKFKIFKDRQTRRIESRRLYKKRIKRHEKNRI